MRKMVLIKLSKIAKDKDEAFGVMLKAESGGSFNCFRDEKYAVDESMVKLLKKNGCKFDILS